MTEALLLLAAAGLEIGGCYLVYGVIRLGWSPMLLAPALAALGLFALALARVDTGGAGRTFAVYGGVYVAASLLWLRLVEAVPLKVTDLAGGALVLAGAAVVLLGGRAV